MSQRQDVPVLTDFSPASVFALVSASRKYGMRDSSLRNYFGFKLAASSLLIAMAGCSGSAAVGGANNAPTISGVPPTSVKVGESYSFTPTASDPDGETLTFSVQNRPAWSNLDTSTGTLSGMTMQGDQGSYSNIVITVSGGLASASLPAFSVAVDQISLGRSYWAGRRPPKTPTAHR